MRRPAHVGEQRKGFMSYAEKIEALVAERDALRRALEIIAVGDAEDPQRQAAEELIALGYWRDIPEARNPCTPSTPDDDDPFLAGDEMMGASG
jgi:hypothetical protein